MRDLLTAHLVRYMRDPKAYEGALEGPVLLYMPRLQVDQTTEGRFNLKTMSGVGEASLATGEALVLDLRKEKNNAFRRGITVGRTSNNDLVLEHPSVSRFHAWFAIDEGTRRWAVHDAGSKNGTVVEGAKLVPRRACELEGRTRVRFGDVGVTYLPAQAFLRLLAQGGFAGAR